MQLPIRLPIPDLLVARPSGGFDRIKFEPDAKESASRPVPASTWTAEKLLMPKEVAERVAVSLDWVRAHSTRKSPRIDHVRVGTLIRFTRQQVEEFLRRQAVMHQS